MKALYNVIYHTDITSEYLYKGPSIKDVAQNCQKLIPPLWRKMSALPPFFKILHFLQQKFGLHIWRTPRTPTLCPQNVYNDKPPDCGRILWKAPKRGVFLFRDILRTKGGLPMRTSELLVFKKVGFFKNYGLSKRKRRWGGVKQCGHFVDKGREDQFFITLCPKTIIFWIASSNYFLKQNIHLCYGINGNKCWKYEQYNWSLYDYMI